MVDSSMVKQAHRSFLFKKEKEKTDDDKQEMAVDVVSYSQQMITK